MNILVSAVVNCAIKDFFFFVFSLLVAFSAFLEGRF